LKGKNPIIFNEDKSLRQYIYVNDLVWNLNKIIRNKITGIHNIASTHVCDQEQVVNSILTFFPKLEPEFISKPEFLQIKDQSLVMDPDLPCTTDFMEGLDLTIKDFVVN
jgi:dTDP-D-glucose 4,6-dehydratase